MKRENERNQIVRDFARLTFEDSLSNKARSAIVEAAIKEEVTIREMLRETVILEAGLSEVAPEITTDESEKDLVLIHCPS